MALLSDDEVAEQKQLLDTYRHTLAIYLRQQAGLGGMAYSPPSVLNGIDEARHTIARIKKLLRDAQVNVADDPDDEAEADWAGARRERAPALPRYDRPSQRSMKRWMLPIGIGLAVIVLAFGILRLVAPHSLGLLPRATPAPTTQTYTVSGASMEPTFHQNQVVQIETLDPTKLQRGDVVLINPFDKNPFLKRIVGMPGETVSIHDGHVYIDNALLPEPYTHGAQTICLADDPCGLGLAIKILNGSFFVLGDNRSNSADSREFGAVPFSQIKGRVRK